MSPNDRKELEWFKDRLRQCSVCGTDNVIDLLKERDSLEAFVAARAESGDEEARAMILHISKPLPNRW